MVKNGTRLQSQVDDTQVIVVKSADSLDDLRCGDVDTAFAAYRDNDRIVQAPTAIDVRRAMVADWWSHRLAGDTVAMSFSCANAQPFDRRDVTRHKFVVRKRSLAPRGELRQLVCADCCTDLVHSPAENWQGSLVKLCNLLAVGEELDCPGLVLCAPNEALLLDGLKMVIGALGGNPETVADLPHGGGKARFAYASLYEVKYQLLLVGEVFSHACHPLII